MIELKNNRERVGSGSDQIKKTVFSNSTVEGQCPTVRWSPQKSEITVLRLREVFINGKKNLPTRKSKKKKKVYCDRSI